MAKMTLYSDNFQSTPYVLPCYELDFMTSFQNPLYSGFHMWHFGNKDLDNFFYSIVFSGKASFSVVGDDTAERHDLIKGLPAPFLQPIKWQFSDSAHSYIQPKDGTYSVITNKPDDWDKICATHIATRAQSNGAIFYSSYTDWNALSQFAGQNNREILKFDYPISRKFLVTGGLSDFSFGIYNGFNAQIPSSNFINYLSSGMAYSIPAANFQRQGQGVDGHANGCSFTNLDGNTPIVSWGTNVNSLPSTGSNTSITYVNSYPVSFMIPKDTVISGVTLPKNASFYGVMSVSFNAVGQPDGFIVQALSSEMWSISSGAGNNFGSDSLPSGGKGKQEKGGYDPRKTITKNDSGGLLTDPTSSAGFVIYQFTPAEFTEFLNKVYTETALPGVDGAWSGVLKEITYTGEGIIKNLINTGWSNTENIVFVKTSPVKFDTQTYNLSKLSIGALGISGVSAQVVQKYIKEPPNGPIELGAIGSNPQAFTDVEPYASASIFFPLAGSVAIPPSVLADSSATVNYSFNLLNEGCGYSIHISKDGLNYLHLAKNGQCAKSADCVIPGRDISGTVSSLGALAATGIATLATGGTAAPALVTTALGAATTAVQEATDLSITNLPPTSSGSPYDDTVNGGLRDIVLYRTKAERFTSGEGAVNQRAGVMGNFSYEYIDSLASLKADSFVSVLDVKVDEVSGMTKAEHDKIVALLKEGVYI